jgi:hypothetical protein
MLKHAHAAIVTKPHTAYLCITLYSLLYCLSYFMCVHVFCEYIQISSILQGMADINLLTMGASRKIRSRFQVLRRPESAAATAALAAELHTQAQQLEERELQRLHAAWKLLCTAGGRAISAGLSQHFGDPAAATAAATASDSTGTQWGSDAPDAELSAVLQLRQPSAAHMDAQWAAAVKALPAAAALPQPYEAALVAKLAAGIKSPRVVRLRLSKEPGFGSCADCPFPEVLQRAEKWVAAGAAV